MNAKFDPLQEGDIILATVVKNKRGELTAALADIPEKLEQPLPSPFIEELTTKSAQVPVTAAECRKQYQELQQWDKDEMQQAKQLRMSHM